MAMRRRCWLWVLAGAILARAAAADAPEGQPETGAGLAVVERLEAGRSFITGPAFAVARSREGLLFVGSNKLSAFDGHDWQLVEVPGTTRILSLTVEGASETGKGGERIWVGGDGPLGYVAADAGGLWSFTALPVQPDPAAQIDIRDIQPDGRGGVLIVTRAQVLHWDGAHYQVWDLPSTSRLFTFRYHGKLHAHQPGVGLYEISAEGPQLVWAERDLPVRDIVTGRFDLPGGGELVVFLEDLYQRKGSEWIRVSAVADLLRGRRAIAVASMGGDRIAIGTAYGGVFICRADGSLVTVVNSQSGLGDDNISAVLSEAPGHLWICTGAGVMHLLGAGEASLFDERNRMSTGVVRRVLDVGGRPMAVTSRRAYEFRWTSVMEPTRASRVEFLWTQLRDAAVWQGQLWVAGAGGIWSIGRDNAVRDPVVTGDIAQLLAPTSAPDRLLFLDRFAVRALQRQGDGWSAYDLDEKWDSPPVKMIEDHLGRIWVAARDAGVVVYGWSDVGRKLRRLARLPAGSQGMPPGTQRVGLTCLGNAIYAFTDSGVFRCSDPATGFHAVAELAGLVAETATSSSDGRTAFWSVRRKLPGSLQVPALIRLEAGAPLKWAFVESPGLGQLGNVSSLDVVDEASRPILWVGGENALLRLQVSALTAVAEAPSVSLLRLRVDGPGELPLADLTRPLVVPPAVERMEFFYTAGASRMPCQYQTRLVGVEDDWSPPRPEPRREFTGLASGSYVFLVRAVDRFGRLGSPVQYQFTVEPAWYRQGWALALWLVAAGTLAWGALKWRERRLRLQALRLEQLVNARTRELSLSNVARADFLDSLGHELQRPLNGIVSLTRQLDGAGVPPDLREKVKLLRLGGESLMKNFQEMLDYSALEYGAMEAEARPFRLEPLLEKLVEESASDGPRPVLRMPADFLDGFVGDSAKLRTIVANFVTNAQRHAPGATAEIAVSCTESASGAAEVLIEVTDHGPGVPPEEQEIIFNRFVRGSRAKQSRVPGTGIGLATCRAMARVLRGSVGVVSPVERGTAETAPGEPGATFFVCVPLRRDDGSPGQTTSPASARETAQNPSRQRSG